MHLIDFIRNPDWHTNENLEGMFEWAKSPDIEQSGEGRRQLGYLDGYEGSQPASQNTDYLKGYGQGIFMRNAAEN